MKTVSRLIEGVTIVDVSGRIVLGEECAAIRDLVSDLLGKGRMKILFNLADVDYIDSAGLGTMVSAFTSVKNHGGQLKLLHLQRQSSRPAANHQAVYRLRRDGRRDGGHPVFWPIGNGNRIGLETRTRG